MSSLDLPGELNRKKFIKALKRLGFLINKTGGRGSHYKAVWPTNHKSITIQSDLRKDVLRYILKAIESISGITWDNIKKEL